MAKDKDTSAQGDGGGQGGLSTDRVFSLVQEHREGKPETGDEFDAGEHHAETEQAEPGGGAPITPKFTERKIRNLIKLPGELAFLRTGCEGVRVTDTEANVMLEDTLDVFNELVKVNPIWLAALGIIVNGAALFKTKTDVLKAWRVEQEAKNEKTLAEAGAK